MSERFMSEVLLIGRDSLGHPRVVDLSSLKIELVVPAPKAHGGSGDLERRLAEARAGWSSMRMGERMKGPQRG